jgi:L-fucose isomerase-like protein
MNDQTVTLVTSGDSRPSANQDCWPAQKRLERAVADAIRDAGHEVERGYPVDEEKGHGFITSQKHGIEVFREIDPERPLVAAFATWQYSQHILPGLISHQAPVLTVANWSGQWPGLVGLLNMNGSLTKAGASYSTLWSEDFENDDAFQRKLEQWLDEGRVEHDTSHVRPASSALDLSGEDAETGRRLARDLRREKAILGAFDEGCMGMYNAIIPDRLLNPTGVFKERLSQSALYHETTQVADDEARRCRRWLDERGMTFHTGSDPATELTDEQIRKQLKMYVAAARMADDLGCDAIGIQYQQGLKDLLPASDLAEGLLNNTERPPVFERDGERELFAGEPIPHFNEVDEGAGLDALVTNRVWDALDYPPETTLHDVRWGEPYEGEYVWVFEISGSVPPAHLGGYEHADSYRQPPMFFPAGGGTIKGYSKPGEIVWSRVYVEDDTLRADVGRGRAVELPDEEAERRSQATDPQWPIMHAVTYGVSRDQMMARHKSNHVQVAYAPDADAANRALAAKAAMFDEMGLEVFVCGDVG